MRDFDIDLVKPVATMSDDEAIAVKKNSKFLEKQFFKERFFATLYYYTYKVTFALAVLMIVTMLASIFVDFKLLLSEYVYKIYTMTFIIGSSLFLMMSVNKNTTSYYSEILKDNLRRALVSNLISNGFSRSDLDPQSCKAALIYVLYQNDKVFKTDAEIKSIIDNAIENETINEALNEAVNYYLSVVPLGNALHKYKLETDKRVTEYVVSQEVADKTKSLKEIDKYKKPNKLYHGLNDLRISEINKKDS